MVELAKIITIGSVKSSFYFSDSVSGSGIVIFLSCIGVGGGVGGIIIF